MGCTPSANQVRPAEQLPPRPAWHRDQLRRSIRDRKRLTVRLDRHDRAVSAELQRREQLAVADLLATYPQLSEVEQNEYPILPEGMMEVLGGYEAHGLPFG